MRDVRFTEQGIEGDYDRIGFMSGECLKCNTEIYSYMEARDHSRSHSVPGENHSICIYLVLEQYAGDFVVHEIRQFEVYFAPPLNRKLS